MYIKNDFVCTQHPEKIERTSAILACRHDRANFFLGHPSSMRTCIMTWNDIGMTCEAVAPCPVKLPHDHLEDFLHNYSPSDLGKTLAGALATGRRKESKSSIISYDMLSAESAWIRFWKAFSIYTGDNTSHSILCTFIWQILIIRLVPTPKRKCGVLARLCSGVFDDNSVYFPFFPKLNF